MKSLVLGVSGGSGSGKTLFLHQLLSSFGEDQISILSMDNYYKVITKQKKDEAGIENFDLPEAIDRKRFYHDLLQLRGGSDIELKEYTFNNTEVNPKIIRIRSAPVIVVEGIFCFYFEEIADLLELKLFIDAPDYLMLTRRITRDAEERGYDLKDVLYRFQHHVTPSFKKYIEPLKHEADLIIPNHHNFSKALKVIRTFISSRIAAEK